MNQLSRPELGREIAEIIVDPRTARGRPFIRLLPPLEEGKAPFKFELRSLVQTSYNTAIAHGFINQARDWNRKQKQAEGDGGRIEAIGILDEHIKSPAEIAATKLGIPLFFLAAEGAETLFRNLNGQFAHPRLRRLVIMDTLLAGSQLFFRLVRGLRRRDVEPAYATGIVGYDFPSVLKKFQEDKVDFAPLTTISDIASLGLRGTTQEVDRFRAWYDRNMNRQ